MGKLSWFLRAAAAAILLQTLFFKFSGAPESKFIFGALGVEPWGRLASGAIELCAAVLLLLPTSAFYGGLIATGVMAGAILSHALVLGYVVQGDGGLLFSLACIVLICSATTTYLHRASAVPLARRIGGERFSAIFQG